MWTWSGIHSSVNIQTYFSLTIGLRRSNTVEYVEYRRTVQQAQRKFIDFPLEKHQVSANWIESSKTSRAWRFTNRQQQFVLFLNYSGVMWKWYPVLDDVYVFY